jgi:hypothetical protein
MTSRYAVVLFCLALAACGQNGAGADVKVAFSLSALPIAKTGSKAPRFAALAAGFQKSAMAANQVASISFTPESVLIPVTRISLSGKRYEYKDGDRVLSPDNGTEVVYQCEGATPQDCLVEVSSPAALEAFNQKLSHVSIKEGVYDSISVANMMGEGTAGIKGRLKVKGTFFLADVTYYTSPAGPTTDAAAAGYVELEISKGDAVFPVVANSALSVIEGSAHKVALFASIDSLVFGQQVSSLATSEENGCVVNKGLEVGICGTQPAMVGYVGDIAPSLETYLLMFSGSDWYNNMTAELVFVIEPASNAVIGILPNQYYAGNGGGKSPNFYGAAHFEQTAVGVFDIGNGDPGSNGYFSIHGFTRSDHEGTIVLEGNGEGNYKAIRR